MKELQSGLQTGLLIAIVTIFLLLVANFQNLRLALIVLTTIPAALLGVVLALKLTGTTVNLQSFMGAIMAVGVAVGLRSPLLAVMLVPEFVGAARGFVGVVPEPSRALLALAGLGVVALRRRRKQAV